MEVRVSVLIDGFNVFHSMEDLIGKGLATQRVKWLDYSGLAESFLPQIGVKGRKKIEGIDYFSAFAHHKMKEDPFHVVRHETFVKVMKDKGIACHIHRFKKRHRKCKACAAPMKCHEEKETDVAMAIRLLQIFVRKEAEIAILVTGDTDIGPAVRATLEMFPAAIIWLAFPYARQNSELANLVNGRGGHFKLSHRAYVSQILPDEIELKSGEKVQIPPKWKV